MAHKNKSNYSAYKARQNARSEQEGGAKKSSPTLKNSLSKSTFSNSSAQSQRGFHRPPDKIVPLEEANDRLYDLFKNHGFADFPHSKRKQLAQYYVLLMEVQKKENFTRLTNLKDIGLKHFIDCLMVPRLTQLLFPLMDVGTGPGLPGIPLKIEFPEETIVLAEGVQRRVEFLKHVREEMSLSNLPILGRNINPECFYPVRGVITRAVEDMRNTLGNVMHSLQTGGRVYFMKGPGVAPEIPMAEDAWGEYYRLVEDHHYVLPKTEQERRLVVFEKIKSPIVTDEFIESLGVATEDDGD